jgi:hypothetical protein
MLPENALFVFLIAFTCSLLVLATFGACIRSCVFVIRSARIPSAATATLPVFNQPSPPPPRKLKDSKPWTRTDRTVSRVINNPGGDICIGTPLPGLKAKPDGHGG